MVSVDGMCCPWASELPARLRVVFHFNRDDLIRRQDFEPLVEDFVVPLNVGTESALQRVKAMFIDTVYRRRGDDIGFIHE